MCIRSVSINYSVELFQGDYPFMRWDSLFIQCFFEKGIKEGLTIIQCCIVYFIYLHYVLNKPSVWKESVLFTRDTAYHKESLQSPLIKQIAIWNKRIWRFFCYNIRKDDIWNSIICTHFHFICLDHKNMGKAARKKTNKKKQFYKDPKVDETETPESKELLYGVSRFLFIIINSSIVLILRFELVRAELLVPCLGMFNPICNLKII